MKENLINFSDIESSRNFKSEKEEDLFNEIKKKKILLIGDFTYGTGNLITAQRIQKILNDLNYETCFYSIRYLLSKENDSFDFLKKFLVKNNISLIIGINVWRSGKIIYDLFNEDVDEKNLPNLMKVIPYLFIVAGTDANVFVKENEKAEIMKKVIQKSEGLISFNENMITNFKELNIDLTYKIIPQSVVINNEKTFNQKEEDLNHIFQRLEIPKGKKIILFPSGMRTVKDPLFIINEIIEFTEKNSEFMCILIGSIYDNNLYEKILNLTKNTKNFIIATSLEHKDFIMLLENSKIVLNSSINEGMSNVILEAMSIGIPVLARKNEGNCKLITNDFNGFLFETPEEFSLKLNKMLIRKLNENDGLNFLDNFIENGKLLIKENFSYEIERDSYRDFLSEIFYRYYFDYENFSFFFSKNTHPFSSDNNEIFDSAHFDFSKKLNSKEFELNKRKEINILDVGCGAGIFSFCFLYKNIFDKKSENFSNFQKVDINLYLSDIDEECVYSTFINLNSYKNIFMEKIYKFEDKYFKFNLNFIEISKGDLAKNVAFDKKYFGFFDIILANLPQTPSEEAIRRDKHGGNMGCNLYIEMFKELRNIIPYRKDLEQKQTEIFILHISLSNPNLLNENLFNLNYHFEILFEHERKLIPNNLSVFSSKLKEYLIELKSQNKTQIEICDDNLWRYKVWMKKITSN